MASLTRRFRQSPDLHGRQAPVVPGIVPFFERVHLPGAPEDVRSQALDHIVPGLGSYGYALKAADGEELRFAWRRRPGWTVLVAVLAFPVGLLSLLYMDTERIAIRFEPGPEGGTWVIAHGVAPLPVRRGFALLRDIPEPPDLREFYLSGS